MKLLVTRHPGALEWLQSRCRIDAHVTHLHDGMTLAAGDIVIGTLPIHVVAGLSARNIRYFHLSIQLPEHQRGQELSATQLHEYGACLEEFCVTSVDNIVTCEERNHCGSITGMLNDIGMMNKNNDKE